MTIKGKTSLKRSSISLIQTTTGRFHCKGLSFILCRDEMVNTYIEIREKLRIRKIET